MREVVPQARICGGIRLRELHGRREATHRRVPRHHAAVNERPHRRGGDELAQRGDLEARFTVDGIGLAIAANAEALEKNGPGRTRHYDHGTGYDIFVERRLDKLLEGQPSAPTVKPILGPRLPPRRGRAEQRRQ